MFGHQNSRTDDMTTGTDVSTTDNPLTSDAPSAPAIDTVVPVVTDNGNDSSTPSNNSAGDYILTEPHQTVTPPAPDVTSSEDKSGDTTSASDDTPPAPVVDDNLLQIKQQALQQLTPLVDHLDQTPEERFRTTMMMIQAADNQLLLKDAYDAAQSITDEKVRAQALLDVINEINYFTQHHENQTAA